MSKDYPTIQQHEPLRTPADWSAQGKRFIAQLEEILDDIYRRFNRLRLKDLDKSLQTTIVESEQGVATLTVSVDGISGSVDALDGRVTDVEVTADGVKTEVQDARGNYSTLKQRADSIETEVHDARGNSSTLKQRVDSIATSVSDAEGNISNLRQTASGLTTRVTDAEGDISTLQQTATTLTSKVGTAEGNISTLQQTATSLTSRVTTAEGNVSTLQQTATSLTSRVGTAEGNISTIQQQANNIELTVGKLNINGTNLLTDGDAPADADGTINNFLTRWTMLENLEVGQDYTLTACITPGSGISYYNIYTAYFSNDNRTWLGRLTPTGTAQQILRLQFTFSGYNEGVGQRSTLTCYRSTGSDVGATTLHWAKLEKGTQTSDEYTPPPSTEPNMLYGGNEEITASTYNVHTWQADDMVAGERYTITACLETASDATAYRLYTNGGSNALGNLSSITIDNNSRPIVASLTFVFAGYGTTNPDNHGIRMYRRPDGATGTTKVHWIEMHKGVGRQVWSPNPNEINNSGIKITNEGIDIYTGGKLNMSGQTEGSLLLPNGDVTAANGNFTNLNVSGAVAALGSTGAELTLYQSVTGWRLNESNGLCSSNSAYKLVKFAVTAGNTVTVVSDDRWQFQNSYGVPASGTSNRVGSTTYGAGMFTMTVPSGATYIIISTPTGGKGYAYSQFTAAAFFMPVKCWFTRGASVKPSTERGYLWFNASTTTITSSTVSASTGGESVSADGRTMTSATITDVLGSGTINYTLSFVLSNYKFAQTQTNTVSVVVSDGTNSLTFTSAATPMPQWNNVQFNIGQSSSTNLFAAKKALTMRFTISNPNGDSYSVCYFTGTPITLTGQSTAAAGEGTVTVKYIS